MATDAMNQLTADKKLSDRIAAARTPQELADILSDSLSDAHIASRDPYTGRFVRTEPAATAVVPAATKAAEPKEFKQTVNISGQNFEFVGSSAESLQSQINSARTVAASLTSETSPAKIARAAEQEAMDKIEADRELRLGTITTAEYLQRTGAIESYLQDQGVDVRALAGEQLQKSWAAAGEAFKGTEEGKNWKGGSRNLELAATLLQTHGWTENGINGDRVAALQAVAKEMREKHLEFDGDHDAAAMEKMTENMTPAEIIEHWKISQGATSGDSSQPANDAFLDTFKNGRSSGLFGH